MYQWENNIKVAEELLRIASRAGGDNGLREGATRAAVGRFYYACYKVANDIVVGRCGNNAPHKKGGKHVRIIKSLLQCDSVAYDENDKQAIVEILLELKKQRTKADYQAGAKFSPDKIAYIKEISKKTCNQLKDF